MPLSRDGQNISVAGTEGDHMAAWGPARARLDRDPAMFTHSVRLTTVLCEADGDAASACSAPLMLSLARVRRSLKYLGCSTSFPGQVKFT